jgi:hypothetical protein
MKEILHETSTEISGKIIINNTSGLVLQNSLSNSIIQATLINHKNDVSFITYYPNSINTTDIILSKGFRPSVINNEVVFYKPGDILTNNNSPNKLKLPFVLKFQWNDD